LYSSSGSQPLIGSGTLCNSCFLHAVHSIYSIISLLKPSQSVYLLLWGFQCSWIPVTAQNINELRLTGLLQSALD